MSGVLINTVGKPTAIKHICYFIQDDLSSSEVYLKEIIYCDYIHPDSDGMATISQYEEQLIERIERKYYTSGKHSHWMIMTNAEENMKTIQRLKD